MRPKSPSARFKSWDVVAELHKTKELVPFGFRVLKFRGFRCLGVP